MGEEVLEPLRPVIIDPDSHEGAHQYGYVDADGQLVGSVMTIGEQYEVIHAEPVLYKRYSAGEPVQAVAVIKVGGRFTSPGIFSDATVVFCDPHDLARQTTAERDRFEFVVYRGDSIRSLTD